MSCSYKIYYEPTQKLSTIADHEWRLSLIMKDKYYFYTSGPQCHPIAVTRFIQFRPIAACRQILTETTNTNFIAPSFLSFIQCFVSFIEQYINVDVFIMKCGDADRDRKMYRLTSRYSHFHTRDSLP